jgi:hypothetical protein
MPARMRVGLAENHFLGGGLLRRGGHRKLLLLNGLARL